MDDMNPTKNIEDFLDWLKTCQRHDMWRWLAEAYWHGQLEGTELARAFLLSKKGVDMRTIPV